jgi:aryl-alcohol dehydrogenase (NADP+)
MEALHDVVKSGKARYIGASSMFAWQLVKAQETAEKNGWTKFVSMQNHLNLIYREEEREMIPLCINDNLAITPWSPLARGFLAGNRSKNGGGKTDRAKNDILADDYYYSKADFKILDCIKKIAKQENRQPVEIALAWLLQKKGITAPIVGPGKLEQLKTLLNSLSLKLSEKQILSLEKPYQPKNISGHI